MGQGLPRDHAQWRTVQLGVSRHETLDAREVGFIDRLLELSGPAQGIDEGLELRPAQKSIQAGDRAFGAESPMTNRKFQIAPRGERSRFAVSIWNLEFVIGN